MLYAHLIEDLLRLHLYECAFWGINGYGPIPRGRIKEMNFENMIDELGKVYGNVQDVAANLHRVRKIRNHLTHAFVDQVGTDLLTEEGLDQIHALLKRVIKHNRVLLKSLQKTQAAVLREGVTHDFMRLMACEDPEFDANVAKSKIKALLKELDDSYGVTS